MNATSQAPTAQQMEHFLTSLYGLDIKVEDTPCLPPDQVYAVAEYISPGHETKAFIACDLQAAAKLGAALALVPMGAVNDSLKAKKLEENLMANLNEGFNIFVNLMPEHFDQRFVLNEVHTENAKEIYSTQIKQSKTHAFKMNIQRYGDGVMAFLLR